MAMTFTNNRVSQSQPFVTGTKQTAAARRCVERFWTVDTNVHTDATSKLPTSINRDLTLTSSKL
jgi:hypothetical protein